MSLISIDECFSSPQPRNVKSERLKVKVKSKGASLTVADLKKAIVRKGYPSLCDAARITLILPDGFGCVLNDDMMASDLAHDASLMALMSGTPREASHLHKDGGLHLPNILYVYHSSDIKTHIKWPHSIVMPNAGQWSCFQTPWSASLPELAQQFTAIGFDHNLVIRELKRLEHRRLPEDLMSSCNRGAGFLVPNLIFRLWDAAGLNGLLDAERQSVMRNRVAPSEFEVFSVSSNFSVDTDTEGTVRGGSPPSSPPRASTSHLAPAAPSVIMASPSEHQSAYDDVYSQSFSAPATTVHGSDCSSESGWSEAPRRMVWMSGTGWTEPPPHMEWPSGQPAGSSMVTACRLSKMIRRVGDLTRERDRLVSDSRHVKEAGASESAQVALLLEEQALKFELERLQYTQELQDLTSANAALRAEVEDEVRMVKDAFEARLRDENAAAQVTENTLRTLQEIKENLSSVVSCSICYEPFGSLSDNLPRRPIHLNCGHIFCATCLSSDWAHRGQAGIEPQARCFNRCPNFDPNRLSEIYLLDEIKDVLAALPDVQMGT